MAKAKQTINGKAFEYACMEAVYNALTASNKSAIVIKSKSYEKARKSFEELNNDSQSRYTLAAQTATKMISGLEPQLIDGEGTIVLEIEPDSIAVGVDGDVRDVLFVRSSTKNGEWEIGISCKHNHEALKHPRITEGKDFGWDWIGIHCSREFIDEITPITDSLISYGKCNTLWRDIKNKHDSYYVPILKAYLKEIEKLCNEHKNIPAKLLSYFFGANDFYKVIMKESAKTTTIEGFNMHGTLNRSNGKVKAVIKVPIIKMPTRLLNAEFKKTGKTLTESKTTIILTFDGGWAVSMRLHNKDDIAKPTSLAWDINLIGLPPSTYVNTRSWYE